MPDWSRKYHISRAGNMILPGFNSPAGYNYPTSWVKGEKEGSMEYSLAATPLEKLTEKEKNQIKKLTGLHHFERGNGIWIGNYEENEPLIEVSTHVLEAAKDLDISYLKVFLRR